jgi:hypothetical protein
MKKSTLALPVLVLIATIYFEDHHMSKLRELPLAFIPLAIVAVVLLSSTALASESCSAHSEFSCPNCGGITVEDCTYCEGYTFTDQHYDLCYDRKLFHVKDNEPGDSDNHYPFLWNDM